MSFPTNTYFTIGMNGGRICQCDMNGGGINKCRINSKRICQCGNNSSKICIQGKTVQDYHNAHFNKFGNINNAMKDHSKMLFFLDPNSVNGGLLNQIEGDIELKEVQLLLKGCKVKAVLIGSSNQSYNTYFKDPADKGEADVFMINADILKEKEIDREPISDDKASERGRKKRIGSKIIKIYKNVMKKYKSIYGEEKKSNQIALSKMIRGGENFLDEIFQARLIKE